jgi:hypothetical protein
MVNRQLSGRRGSQEPEQTQPPKSTFVTKNENFSTQQLLNDTRCDFFYFKIFCETESDAVVQYQFMFLDKRVFMVIFAYL